MATLIYPSIVATRYKPNGCISCVKSCGLTGAKKGMSTRLDITCSTMSGGYALGHIQDSTVCIAVSEASCGMLQRLINKKRHGE